MELIKVSNLGQLNISESNDNIYLIDNDVVINVYENVNANILDISNNKKIVINASYNSNVNYYVIDSSNTNKEFNILGNLNLLGISLNKTDDLINVNLNKENAIFESRYLSFAKSINVNCHINVYHNKKSTISNVSNFGVALDGGNIMFDVVSKIEKGMAKSNAKQLSRGVVIDDNSKVSAKPILLIDEYDCFANHGASIGKISDDELFYLMSRGLSKNDACLLILEGIIKPFIDAIPLEEYKNSISDKVRNII